MPLKAWHSPANLILSTAANINGYFWGDGGKGTATEFTPRVVYDLMDCQITLTLSSYIYTGKQLRPTVQSVKYDRASDRDSKNIFASAITKTLPSSGYSISGYGENIHCPSGTVTVLGAQNGSRTTVQTNEAVIGSAEVTFTINKATLTAPITMDPSKPYLNQSATASLSTYTSATAGTGQLAGQHEKGGGAEGHMVGAEQRRNGHGGERPAGEGLFDQHHRNGDSNAVRHERLQRLYGDAIGQHTAAEVVDAYPFREYAPSPRSDLGEAAQRHHRPHVSMVRE